MKNLKKVHLQVLDLTPYEFSEGTINLLMEGLTFTPTPPSNESKIRAESNEFVRKLRLKEYFVDKTFNNIDLVRPKSGFTPKTGRVPELDNLAGEIKEKRFQDNLNKQERKALSNLQKNDNIVIKEADKSGVTIMKWLWNTCKILVPTWKPT